MFRVWRCVQGRVLPSVIRSSNPFAYVGHVCVPVHVLQLHINASELINVAEPVQKCLYPLQALILGSLQAEAPACLYLSTCIYPMCECELTPKPWWCLIARMRQRFTLCLCWLELEREDNSDLLGTMTSLGVFCLSLLVVNICVSKQSYSCWIT